MGERDLLPQDGSSVNKSVAINKDSRVRLRSTAELRRPGDSRKFHCMAEDEQSEGKCRHISKKKG
jgi:hypothetical protein